MEVGNWICVKNIHLIPNWLNELDIKFQSTTTTTTTSNTTSNSTIINDGFRLFLTSESIKNLPEIFVAKCNKIFYEEPDGIKNKIQRLLQQWGSTLIDSGKDQKVVKLYNILFILNAIIQERRSFVPQGGCILFRI